MGEVKKIFILQSLKTSDSTRVGEELNKRLQDHIPTTFFDISTREELFTNLALVRDEIRRTPGRYVVHFHCHGNDDGIGVFDQSDALDFISWSTLRKHLREIYEASAQKIIASFCSCEGFNAMKLIPALEPCPYYMITGSLEKIGFEDSIEGYFLYYKNLNDGKSATDNITEVNTTHPKMKFLAFTAVQLVDLAWDGYAKRELTPERIVQRKSEIKGEIIALAGRITPEQEKLIDDGLTEDFAERFHEKFKKIFFA